MKTLQTETMIEAPAQKVWEVLMDHKNYVKWNPFIKELSGATHKGAKLDVTIKSGPDKTMNFTPIVLINEKEKEFRWLGHLYIKGLFDGEHFFKLEALSSSKTRFIHGENFTGIMAGVLLKMIGDSTLEGFESMNAALKQQVELTDGNNE